jgi:tetratricopeptide (TPR) repeat protein
MILAPAAIVDPLDPAVLNEDQELDALAQSLRVSNGFKLFLAVCNSPLQRGRLIDRLRERLPEINLQHLRLDMPIDHLLGELQEKIDGQADAVAVDGLELSLGDAEQAARSPLVAHLNAARNSFPEVWNRPLVLWLPRYGLTAVMQGAPDFGSIRSGTFFFAEPPDAATLDRLTVGDWWTVTSLPPDERAERIATLNRLLEDLRSLPADQQDRRAELRLLHSLAGHLAISGRFSEAESHWRSSLRIAESLGNRVLVAAMYQVLGVIAGLREDLQTASDWLRKALHERVEVFGTELHPSVVESLHLMARVLKYQGDLKGARRNLERAMEIQASLFSTESRPEMAESLLALAEVLRQQGDLAAAREHVERSLAIQRAVFGTEFHPAIAKSMHVLARVAQAYGDLAAARQYSEQALEIQTAASGTELHPNVADSLQQLAGVLRAQGDLANSRRRLERALEIQAAVFGTQEHIATAFTEMDLATLLLELNESSRAVELLEHAYGVFERLVGSEHPYTRFRDGNCR